MSAQSEENIVAFSYAFSSMGVVLSQDTGRYFHAIPWNLILYCLKEIGLD